MTGADGFVDRLVVGISYETDTASIKTVMGEFKGAFDSLTGFAAGLLSAAIAGGVFALKQASAMDATGDLAEQLRTTTEELTALEYAAHVSGASTQELDQSLLFLDRALGEASKSGTPAAQAMAQLGLSAYDADGQLRDAAGSVDDIAGALAGVQDEGTKSRIITDLFGRSAAKMRPLLERGAEGIHELTEEAARLGLVLSSESAAAASDLMDATEGLKGAVRGLGWQIADVLIPPLTEATEGLTDWLLAEDGIVHGGMERFVRGLSWVLEQLDTPLGKGVAGVTALAGAVGLLRASGDIPVIGSMLAKIAPVALKFGLWGLVIAGVALAVDDLLTFMDGGDSVIGRFFDMFGFGDQALNATQTLFNELWRSGEALGVMFSDLSDVVNNELKAAFNTDLTTVLEGIGHAVGVIAAADLVAVVRQWVSIFRELADVLETVSEYLDPKAFLRGFLFAATAGKSETGAATDLAGSAIAGAVGSPADAFGSLGGPLAQAAGAIANNVTIGGVTLNVSAGASKNEIAEAVKRQVLRDLDAVEGLQ